MANIIAVIWDCDKTLVDGYMQDPIFEEYGIMIEVQTHNTDLKKRLTAFAANYPECCRQIDDDEQGGLTFKIKKGRLSFRLTAPYSEERKQAASEWAKKNGIKG